MKTSLFIGQWIFILIHLFYTLNGSETCYALTKQPKNNTNNKNRETLFNGPSKINLFLEINTVHLINGVCSTRSVHSNCFIRSINSTHSIKRNLQEQHELNYYSILMQHKNHQKPYTCSIFLTMLKRVSILWMIFFLIAGFLLFFLLLKVLQLKEKAESFQNMTHTLQKTLVDLQFKETILTGYEKQSSESLLWKLNVLVKFSLLESEFIQGENVDIKKIKIKINKIIFGANYNSPWEKILEAIDELYPGLSHFVKSRYPQFTDTDFKVTLLSYIGLPSKEIATLICQSIHTVSMSRTQIRKKMNLKESGADFCLILKQSYEENRQN